MKALYFSDFESAIKKIKELLLSAEWEELTSYYCLTGSSIDLKELLSGDFFIREERPETAHPGSFWKYKHPFPPSFKYDSHYLDGDIAIVKVSIEIDQGMGMIQRGQHQFRMIKMEKGYQILPD